MYLIDNHVNIYLILQRLNWDYILRYNYSSERYITLYYYYYITLSLDSIDHYTINFSFKT